MQCRAEFQRDHPATASLPPCISITHTGTRASSIAAAAMGMLTDTPTVAAGASSSPVRPWGMASQREFVLTRPEIGLPIFALCWTLAFILCEILGCCCCTEDEDASAPSLPHAAAATATAADGPAIADDNTGMKKRELWSIPVVVYEYEAKPGASATECAICLGEFEGGEKVRVLPGCHHGFHVQCIDQWLAKRPSCPTCRNSLVAPPAG